MLKPTLNPTLRDFWRQRARYRVLYGGRASSKSWDAAGFLVYLMCNYRLRVCCTREFQNKLEESVYTLVLNRAEAFGVRDQFVAVKSGIRHLRTGSEAMFYGRARNIDEIKGLEDIDIFWHEECEALTADEWRVIEATLRKQGGQHWIIFNPRLVTDFVWETFVLAPPEKSIVRAINYDENPFLSQDMRDVIAAHYLKDPDEAAHVYGGQPLTDDDRVIIKLSWIEAAVDAHIKLGIAPAGERVLGFDVADDGGDKCANVYKYGCVLMGGEEWSATEDQLPMSTRRTAGNARTFGPGTLIGYDSIGVGAFVGGYLTEIDSTIEHFGFNAGAGVHDPDGEYLPGKTNKDHFANIKSQAWQLTADRFRNTYNAVVRGHTYEEGELLCIDSASFDPAILAKLKRELATPRRDYDSGGRVMVEQKKALAKRSVASPNLADAAIICNAPRTRRRGFYDL